MTHFQLLQQAVDYHNQRSPKDYHVVLDYTENSQEGYGPHKLSLRLVKTNGQLVASCMDLSGNTDIVMNPPIDRLYKSVLDDLMRIGIDRAIRIAEEIKH